MRTTERIQKLEREISTLWQIVEDERLWHPSVIRQIRQRSRSVRRDYSRGRLHGLEDIFTPRSRR